MTSVLTNGAAISALQTLRSISSNLDTTQRMVSSGLRVGAAADNAAYWSISTTMRSDRMAISAVYDALGLGAAKVDTAYAGMSAVTDVMAEFKAKLIAAKEDGVDKSKIQSELNQLKEQAVSVATSASFSGQNWLNTTIADMFDVSLSTDTVVSSFVRNGDGVSVKTTGVEISKISLFNTSGDGLLQIDSRAIGDIGGLRPQDRLVRESDGWEYYEFTGPATFAASDVITFDLTVDASVHGPGKTYTLTIDKTAVDQGLGTTDGVISSPRDWMYVLAKAQWNEPYPIDPTRGGGKGQAWNIGGNPLEYGFFTPALEGLPGSSIRVTNVNSTLAGGHAFGIESPIGNDDGGYASFSFVFGDSFRMKTDVEFSFDLTVSGSPARSIRVTRDDVNAALGITDGMVSSAADMASVLNHVLVGQGIESVTASGSLITLNVDSTMYPNMGYRSFIGITNVVDNIGNPPDINFVDIDITLPSASIDHYIDVVESMSRKVIAGASVLGALSKRIEMQTEFADTLMASIDRGVGRLVDADMNEASVRLKAIQTRQQLAIHSLSIANSNAENVMQLFR
nr:flagellin [uncultured Agrobacterium sp.]